MNVSSVKETVLCECWNEKTTLKSFESGIITVILYRVAAVKALSVRNQ